MSLVHFYNERVRIVDTDGAEFVGMINDYCYPEDNENNKESIIIDCEIRNRPIEFYENDILSIEIVS